MQDRTPDPATLEPVEPASADELRPCSSTGCSGHCGTRTTTCRTTGRRSTRPGSTRTTAARWRTWRVPVHHQAGPARELPVRDVRRPAGAGVPGPRLVRHDGPPDGRRLHGAGHHHLVDLMARSIRAAGGRAGDLVHVAYGYGLFTGGLGAHYGAEGLGCTVIPVSGGMTERQVMLIRDFEPEVIMVTPSYMLAIVDEMERQGVDPRSTSLQVGIFGAEPWTDDMRREIEQRLDMHAVDIYGLSEVMGPGVAQECVETKDGLHMWEDHFYPEVVDPSTDEVLPDGEMGELVFTSLTKQAMPVIRYRTRDLTRLLPAPPGRCAGWRR